MTLVPFRDALSPISAPIVPLIEGQPTRRHLAVDRTRAFVIVGKRQIIETEGGRPGIARDQRAQCRDIGHDGAGQIVAPHWLPPLSGVDQPAKSRIVEP